MDPLSFAWSSLSLFLTLSLSRTIDVFSALVSLTVNFRFSTQRQYQDLRRYPSLCRIMETFCYCCCSVSQSCPILCDPMDCSSQASLSFTISQSLLKPMSIDSTINFTNFFLHYCYLPVVLDLTLFYFAAMHLLVILPGRIVCGKLWVIE